MAAEAGAAGPSRLESLSKELLYKIWPDERIIMGRAVSTTIKREIEAREGLVLVASFHKTMQLMEQPYAEELIAGFLQKFKSLCVVVQCKDGKNDPMPFEKKVAGLYLRSLARASAAGWRGLHGLMIGLSSKEEHVQELYKALEHASDIKVLDVKAGIGRGRDFGAKMSKLIKDWRSITDLSLSHNRIEDSARVELFKHLTACISLEKLDLGYTCLLPQGAKALAEILTQLPVLKVLDIRGNKLKDEGATALGSSLQACVQLESLNICCNCIDDAGFRSLGSSLEHNTALTFLHFGGEQVEDSVSNPSFFEQAENSIGSEGAEAMGQALRKMTKLQSFNMQTCWLSPTTAWDPILMALQNCQHLRFLNLGRNYPRFTAENMRLLAETLPQCRALTHLILQGMVATEDTPGNLLPEALVQCPNLRTLDLHGNEMGVFPGVIEGFLAQASRLTNLDALHLGENMLGNGSVKKLCRVLPDMTSLRQLELSHNGIRSSGALELFKLLPRLTQICDLNLEENSVGNMAIEELANLVPRNTTLTSLNLCSNPISDSGATHLASALEHTLSLKILLVDECRIKSAGMEVLMASKEKVDTHIDIIDDPAYPPDDDTEDERRENEMDPVSIFNAAMGGALQQMPQFMQETLPHFLQANMPMMPNEMLDEEDEDDEGGEDASDGEQGPWMPFLPPMFGQMAGVNAAANPPEGGGAAGHLVMGPMGAFLMPPMAGMPPMGVGLPMTMNFDNMGHPDHSGSGSEDSRGSDSEEHSDGSQSGEDSETGMGNI